MHKPQVDIDILVSSSFILNGNVMVDSPLIIKSKEFALQIIKVCNFVKQNIFDEKLIIDLHNFFVSLNKECISYVLLAMQEIDKKLKEED